MWSFLVIPLFLLPLLLPISKLCIYHASFCVSVLLRMCAAVLCACLKKFPSMLQCLDLIVFLTFVLNCRFLRSITLLLASEQSHPILPSRPLVMDTQVALTSPHPKHSCSEHPCNAFTSASVAPSLRRVPKDGIQGKMK